MKNKNIDVKKILKTLTPVFVAVAVVVVLAISGNITKQSDTKNPDFSTTSTTAATTTKPQNTKVSLVAVGDNLIHNTVIAAGKQADGTYDYTSCYETISPYIKDADLACINQETILGGSAFEYTGYPLFNTPWEVGDACIAAGFDVFTCATNHTLDKGVEGINQALAYFSQNSSVTYAGINATQEDADKITYVEKNGITFAILSYTYGTNGIPLPQDTPWVVNMLEEEKVTKDITEARKNADVVIVFPHWGIENSHNVSEQQEKYVKLFSDLGVDIVIGTHSHVLQPVEWYTNQETGKKMLVYYSLGNFISHQINKDQLCGGMAQITIEKIDGEISISSAKLAPLVCHYRNTGNGYDFNVYMLKDYTTELANTHAQSGITPEYCTQLCQDIISEEFLKLD